MFNPSNFEYRSAVTNADRLEADAMRLDQRACDVRYTSAARVAMVAQAQAARDAAKVHRERADYYKANGFFPLTRYKQAA